MILNDGAGYKACAKKQEELNEAGLIEIDGDRSRISKQGEEATASLLNPIREESGEPPPLH